MVNDQISSSTVGQGAIQEECHSRGGRGGGGRSAKKMTKCDLGECGSRQTVILHL